MPPRDLRRIQTRLGARNIGLDGVVAQQDNYRRSGFVYAYDAGCFPAPRAAFLDTWLTRPGTTALAVPGDGAIRGYGVIRAARRGHKIGPLIADTPALADRLFLGLRATVAGGPVFLDVPLPNEAAVSLAREHGMSAVFETARMYTGEAPAVALDRVFGITTFELG